MARLGEFFNPYADIEIHGSKLPHWQQSRAIYFLTWRLADSIPAERLRELADQRNTHMRADGTEMDSISLSRFARRFAMLVEESLDEGLGSCVLCDGPCQEVIRKELESNPCGCVDSYVIMPNHIHLVVGLDPEVDLTDWVMRVKGRSSRLINLLIGSAGRLWQGGYWDRMVRDEEHLMRCRQYIAKNPKKAGLREGEYSMVVAEP